MSDEKPKGSTLTVEDEDDGKNVFNFTGDSNVSLNEDDDKNLDEIDQELVKLGGLNQEEDDDDDDDDDGKMAELEAEMDKLETQRSLATDDGINEDDEGIMAELDAEIEREEALMYAAKNGSVNGSAAVQGVDNRTYNSTGAAAGAGKAGGSYLPVGATPSRNGVLSPHAAEFWFPECRDCPCCKGFKHGCSCRQGNINTCQNANCTSAGSSTPAASFSVASAANNANTATNQRPASSAPAPVSTRPTGGYLPSGAVPSQKGVLSPQAAEFWFPECRDCACCNGFKHGCPCRARGVNVCQQCGGGGGGQIQQQQQQPQYSQQQQTAPSSYGSSSQYSSYSMPPSSTTQICRFYAAGRCSYGASCRFSHAVGSAGTSSNSGV